MPLSRTPNKSEFMGKISLIKMVVAPHFNYISMMGPASIPPGNFKHFNQLIRDFLWSGKKPRVNILFYDLQFLFYEYTTDDI